MSGENRIKKRGPFTVISSKQVYKNPWIEVVEDKIIRPDGKEGMYGVVRDFGGVSVLPLDANGDVYLKREYAYAINQEEIAAVAGGRNSDDEQFLDAARRELKEESGITAKTWVDLGLVHPLTTNIWMPERLFLAMDLTFGALGPDELIKIEKVSFEQAMRWALDGTIVHAGSLVLIFRVAEYLKNHGR